jgi:hypothetical protein
MVFDFIRIPYLYGGKNPKTGLDCFYLACLVRYRYAGNTLMDFNTVYDQYTAKTEPDNLVVVNIQKVCGGPKTTAPEHLDLIVIHPKGTTASLATVVEEDSKLYVVMHTRDGSRVQTLGAVRRMSGVKGVWDSSPLVVPYEQNPLELT